VSPLTPEQTIMKAEKEKKKITHDVCLFIQTIITFTWDGSDIAEI
jgi:hypothetical protein